MSHTPSPTAAEGAAPSPPIYAVASSVSNNSLCRQQKPAKNMWRCDVCNYDTAIARNLRIHMASEKHMHNMVILQQVGGGYSVFC